MKSNLFCLLVALIGFASCKDKKADISVFNKVSNVQLENVSFCKRQIAGRMLPGTSKTTTISEQWGGDKVFPLSGPLEFTMVRGNDRVFLKTKETFYLEEGDEIHVVIDENTEVFNPATEN